MGSAVLEAGRVSAIQENPPKKIRFIKPTLPEWSKVEQLYISAYKEGMITNGPLVRRFEAEAAERLNVKHCVAVSSCTSGLMLTMRALGITGDVIMPSFTFFATALAARWAGLRPVLVDCDPHTFNIDPQDIERRITPQTSAIVAVHMYGNPCDVDALGQLAEASRCKLIFDAAHAFGSVYRGAPIGHFGNAEVFSLSPTKLLVAGEGGLVATNDTLLARRISAGRNYGDTGNYDPIMNGLNARMTEFNAALGVSGLPMLDAKIRRHNAIAELYTAQLSGIPGIRFQHVDSRNLCAYKDFSILVDPEISGATRDEIAQILLLCGYETKRYFDPPVHGQTIFQDLTPKMSRQLPVTERISSTVLSLPIYQSLDDSDIVEMCSIIRSYLVSVQTGERK